ncbi:MAG: hypothetical protein RLZZ230_661 [Candidatus Parcubacteria bacterium]|jgi:phosphoribosylaminoimidazole-succinocarboxamide synthase
MKSITQSLSKSRAGSSKIIYLKENVEDSYLECLQFVFTNQVSIFDIGPLPQLFPGLGNLRCAISGYLFQKMKKAGFDTHYISHDIKAATMNVKAFNVKELDADYGEDAYGRVLGVEVIYRRVITEKLMKRIKAGEIDSRSIELLTTDGMVYVGAALSPPFVECTTKYEPADRYLSDVEAARVAGVNYETLLKMYHMVIMAADFLTAMFANCGPESVDGNLTGYDLLDGKFELGLLRSGEIVIVDSISPDEMRLVRRSDGQSCDKDPVREYYQDNFQIWYQSVLQAKKEYPDDKSMWPAYPDEPIPEKTIQDVVGCYRSVAEAIGAIPVLVTV